MTTSEWRELWLEVTTWWRGNFTEEDMAGYYSLLGEHERDEVRGALVTLASRGGTFIPSAAEIKREVLDRRVGGSAPAWDEAWPQIRTALSVRPHDPWGRLSEQGAHPFVLLFLQSYGVERLKMEPVDDPDYGGAVLSRLRNAYDEFVERSSERIRQGQPVLAPGVRVEQGLRQVGQGLAGMLPQVAPEAPPEPEHPRARRRAK